MITLEEHRKYGKMLKELRLKLIHDPYKKYRTKAQYNKSREKKAIKLIDKLNDNMEEVMYSDHSKDIDRAVAISAETGFHIDYLNIYYGDDINEEIKSRFTKIEILKSLEDGNETK